MNNKPKKRQIAIVKLYADTRDKLVKRRDRQQRRSIADVVEDLVKDAEAKK